MARCATMFLLAGAARALRGHRLHHLARPSRTVMSAATLDRTTPTKLQDAESFLKDIDVFIFDCDGVIWKGDSLIDKVPSVLELLRKLGKKIFFVTNNSTKSRKGYKGKFEKLGLDVEPEEIFSSSFAAAAYLEQTEFKKTGKKVYIIGEVGIEEELDPVWKSNFGCPAPSTRRASVAASARWRRDSTPSTRRCPRGHVSSMAWKLTKVHAIFLGMN